MKKQISIYETYKNTAILHGIHIYSKAYDVSKAKMCAYPKSDHELQQWKYVLRRCTKFPCVIIPDQ